MKSIHLIWPILLSMVIVSIILGVSFWYRYKEHNRMEVVDQEYALVKYPLSSPKCECECPKVEEVDSGIDIVDSDVSDVDKLISDSQEAGAKADKDAEFLIKWITNCKEDVFVYKNLLKLCMKRNGVTEVGVDGGTE